MSAEAGVKKRGRPRKISPEVTIAEPIEAPATVSSTTSRKKSTKASNRSSSTKSAQSKTTKATTSHKVEADPPSRSVIRKTIVSEPIQVDLPSKATPSSVQAQAKATTELSAKASIKPTPTTKPLPAAQLTPSVTPATSNILSKVRELSLKTREASAATNIILDSIPTSTPTPTPASASPTSPAQPSAISSTQMSGPTPKATPKSTAQAAKNIPFKGLNSAIVGNISKNAGARGQFQGQKPLPPNYKPVARKVTMTIVALPIAIVTSYVLYQRLVLGEERKKLVPDDTVASK